METSNREKESQIKILTHELNTAERRFKEELRIQSRFNAANSNSIIRLRDQFAMFNNRIHSVNNSIRKFFARDQEEVVQEDDNDTTRVSFLENNVERLIQTIKEQERLLNQQSDNRHDIITLLKRPFSKTEPLIEIVRKYVEKENRAKLAVYREIEKLNKVLHSESKDRSPESGTTDLRLMKNMIATLRVEIEHLHKKVHWKELQIQELGSDIEILRQGVRSSPRGHGHGLSTKHKTNSKSSSSLDLSKDQTTKHSYSKHERQRSKVKVIANPLEAELIQTITTKCSNGCTNGNHVFRNNIADTTLNLPEVNVTRSPEPEKVQSSQTYYTNNPLDHEELDNLYMEELANQLATKLATNQDLASKLSSNQNSHLPPIHTVKDTTFGGKQMCT